MRFFCAPAASSAAGATGGDAGTGPAARKIADEKGVDLASVQGTGPKGNVLTHVRRDGMLAERERLGLEVRDEWIMRGDFSLQSGRDAAQRILGMQNRPTAVFCASDMVAFGLISGLHAGGLSVPGDISVVGFDDIEMSEFYVPALTTIRQDRRSLGERAAVRLIERLEASEGAAAPIGATQVELVDVSLIVRASTAAV